MHRGLQSIIVTGLLALTLGCPSTPTPKPTPAPGKETKPSPGPIIILRPQYPSPNTFTTSWTVADGVCDANQATEAGTLRLDAFGTVTTMRVWKKDGNFVDITGALSLGFTVQDVDGNNHAIEIRRTPKGYFQWKSNSTSLLICDMASSDCLNNCTNGCGLPKDLFGTIVGTPQFGGVSIADVDHVEFKADYTNPCQ